MDDKISQPISENGNPDREPDVQNIITPEQEKPNADQGIKHKKPVIALKPGIVVLAVVVLVELPQKTVHDKFVAEPGHEFHKKENTEKNQ